MKTLKTNCLFWIAASVVLVAGYGTASAFTVNGHAECSMTCWVPYGAKVEVFDVDPLPGNSYHTDAQPLDIDYIDSSGDFSLTFTWPTGGQDFEVGGPDLVFRFTQNVGGNVQTIYDEPPSQTHWNVPNGSNLNFLITSSLAVCSNPNQTLPPSNNDFLFTRIGSCEVAHLSKGLNNTATLGYFRAQADGYTGNPNITAPGTDTDQPFGATLTFFGWFGLASDATCYKLLYRYSTDNGNNWYSWSEVDRYLSSSWYDTVNYKFVPQKMGPFSPAPDGGTPTTNLYRIPFKVDINKTWSYIDRIAIFNTNSVPDGLCEIKVQGYVWDGIETHAATPATNLDNNFPDSKMILRIDNTPPAVTILGLKINNTPMGVCQILSFGANDNISVKFRAFDKNGHLGRYALNAMYGHNSSVSPKPSTPNLAMDDYNNNSGASPSWQGNLNYTTTYNANLYNSNAMPTCAYQFRLHASKRTTNGYGLIYRWVEDTWHVTIQR